MEKIILNNNIPLIIKENKSTPRTALCMFMSLNEKEQIAGEIALIKSLLFQGTKTKSGEQLANMLEENGIACYVTSSQDYICFKIQCLNEDFKLALSILNDIIFNSTFEEIEKEKNKIKGEFLSDLDSPQVIAFDEFTKTMFKNHPYGNTRSVIINEIDKITKEDVISYYQKVLNNSDKSIVAVGDFEAIGGKKAVEQLICEYFSELSVTKEKKPFNIEKLVLKQLVTKTKKDSAQAQIIQGWRFPSITHKDRPAIAVMNNILGSSGLSSRLFLELREKKGLAYTVRSCYDAFEQCGCLWVYIGTNPVNIQTSFDGFKTEIDKIKNEYVSEEELIGGKNNILGKRQFILETNIEQATIIGMYELLGLGYDYEQIYQEKIKEVTAQDIKRVANEYFTDNYILCVLASSVKIKL